MRDSRQGVGAISGSREPGPSGPGPSGFDPGRSVFDRWRSYADRLYRSAEIRREFENEYRNWYRAKFGMEPEVNGADPLTFFPVWATYRMAFSENAALIDDADAAIVGSSDYISRLQEYVEATEQFLITQGGELWGLEANCEMRGKKHWQRFVKARDAIAMEARQGGDGETRPHPKDESAGPKDIARTPSVSPLSNEEKA